MKRSFATALLMLTSAGVFPARAQEPDLSNLMGALNAMMNARTNQPTVTVVDFRELRALFPESIGAYKRTKSSGEKSGAMGMAISQAEGRYENSAALLQIKLADYGAMGMASMLSAAWAVGEIDRESDSGFERTFQKDGHRGVERYDADAKYGDLQLLVANRFMVEIEVRDGAPADLRAALDALDLKKLAALGK